MSDSFYNEKVKENYLINVDFKIKNDYLNTIPAKLYLPQKRYDQPYLYIKIPKNQIEIFHHGKGSIIYKSPQLEIESSEVWFTILPYEKWSNQDIDAVVFCEPQNLQLKRINKLYSSDKPKFEVFISPNSFINFFTHDRFDIKENGEINNKKQTVFEFEISPKRKIKICNKYKFKSEDTSSILRSKYLTIQTNLDQDNLESDIGVALLEINDFLLLTSYISRQRTFYYQWKLCYTDYEITFYRGNYSFPKEKDEKEKSLSGIIIDPKYKIFMDQTFKRYQELNKIKSLAYPIHYLTTINSDINIESKFLTYFAGIETLLDFHKIDSNLEKCLNSSKDKKFQKYLRNCIRDYELITDDQKGLIISKLPDLNRISLQIIYESFREKYNIKDKDLWPMFCDNGELGLSKLRNNLIHGATIPKDYLKYMILATENLKFLLERSMLCILNWDITDSNIDLMTRNDDRIELYKSELTKLFK